MRKLLLFSLLSLLVQTSLATTYTYTGNGNWSDASKWSPSYPGITINNTDWVYINGTCTLDVNLYNYGTLFLYSGNNLSTSELTVGAALTLDNAGLIDAASSTDNSFTKLNVLGTLKNGTAGIIQLHHLGNNTKAELHVLTGGILDNKGEIDLHASTVSLHSLLHIHTGAELKMYNLIAPYIGIFGTLGGYIINDGVISGTGGYSHNGIGFNVLQQSMGCVIRPTGTMFLNNTYNDLDFADSKIEFDVENGFSDLISGINTGGVLSSFKLNGCTIDVKFKSGYNPQSGHYFDLIKDAGVTGTPTINLPPLPSGLQWQIIWNPIVGTALRIQINGAPNGIQDVTHAQINHVRVYQGRLLFEYFQNGEQLHIYSSDGRLIKKHTTDKGTNSVDISSLAAGWYVLVEKPTGSYIKFIK